MSQLINQYSAMLFTALIAAIIFLLFRRKQRRLSLILPGLLLLGAIAAWFFMRPVQTPELNEAGEVQAMIGMGTPVLLEFQSPY